MGKPSSKDSYEQLSSKQKQFVEHYMNGHSLEDCVTKAGYVQKHPRKYGSRILELPSVKQEIERRNNQIIQKTDVTKRSQIEDLQRMKEQFETLLKLVNTPPSNRSEDEKQQMKELKEIFKLRDIERILDQQNRLLGLYEADQLEVKHSIRVDLIGNGDFGDDNVEDVDHQEINDDNDE